MLVLSRKRNEKIVINHDITICVVDIRGDKVRLGIQAPPDVPVHREEVEDAIARAEAAAAAEPDATETGPATDPNAAEFQPLAPKGPAIRSQAGEIAAANISGEGSATAGPSTNLE